MTGPQAWLTLFINFKTCLLGFYKSSDVSNMASIAVGGNVSSLLVVCVY